MPNPTLAHDITLRELATNLAKAAPELPRVLAGVAGLLRVQLGLKNSIGAVLERGAAEHPDRRLLLWEDRSWTYGQFNGWVNRLAAALAAEGLGHGDVLAILGENHPTVLALVMACAKRGIIAGMANPNLKPEAQAHSLKVMKARAVAVAGECLELWRQVGPVFPETPVYWFRGNADGFDAPAGTKDLERLAATASSANPASTSGINLTDVSYYILTSGTTGLPKASVMTHKRWLLSMAGMGRMSLRLGPDDILYCALPLYHNNALTVSWSAVLGCGAALALDRKFSASRFWERTRHYGATAFTYIGELCRYLLLQPARPDDASNPVRAVIGNGLQPDIWDEFKRRFGITQVCEFYGASEGNTAFVNGFNLDRTAGYCPYPFAVVAFDPDTAQPRRTTKGFLTKVAPGAPGLLISEVTKRAPFDGYTDAKAGAGKLLRDAFKKGDTWYNTGDVVREQGFRHIQFVDRLGDTFRWKGENVATTEVEAALRAQPGVGEVTVYGVAVPRADGRAGMAALHLDGDFDGKALADALAARLPPYAVPLFIRRIASLETTATFKNAKVALRDQGADPAAVTDPVYVLADRSQGYEPLTPALWARLADGSLRL